MAHHQSNRPPNHHGKVKPPRRKPSNHQRAESKHPQIENNLQNPGGKLYEQKELSLALQVHARTLETDIESRLSHSDISVLRADIPDLTLKSDIAELANTWLRLLDNALFFNLVRIYESRFRKSFIMSHRQHGHPNSSRKASGKPASKSSGERLSAKQHSNAHTHPKIEDDLPNARQHTYFGRDLARTLRYNAEKDIETVLGDHEINLLQDPIPEVSSTRESKNLMNTYFLIFDQAFFCNLLGKDLKERISIYDDRQNDASLGYYKDGIIHINMTIQDRTGPPGEKQLAVLLHEMLHAFLDLYTCNCSKCEKRTAEQGGFGATGHGSTWANSMIYLQKSLARQVGWDVDCGVERGVYTEMNASGWQPRPEQFERWNIKSSHVPQVKKHHERGKHKKRPKGSACVVM